MGQNSKAVLWLVSVFMILGLCLSAAPAYAKGNTGRDEALLDVLLKNGTITQTQYDSLAGQVPSKVPSDGLVAVWSNGTRFKHPEGAFDIKIGGRILNDWAAINADGELEDAFGDTLLQGTGTEMRQARLSMSGTIYDHITFKAEYDFAGGDADFKDVWMGMKNVPLLGEIRVGHQKEPMGLSQLNNVMYLTFIERSISFALVNGRNTGLKVHNSAFGNRLGWAAGVYKDVDDTGDGFKDGADFNVTGRISVAPLYADKGRRLLHLALAYSRQCRDDAAIRYRERPETHITDARLADTGNIKAVEAVDLINPELGLVVGPFSVQGEYIRAAVDSSAAHDPKFAGFYVFGSFFITGENRSYRMDDGGGEFTRVKVKNNFAMNHSGWGAWEAALRYSWLDLNDQAVAGGKETSWTAGVNWYLNANLRWSLNYIATRVEDRVIDKTYIHDAAVRIWLTRFQIYF